MLVRPESVNLTLVGAFEDSTDKRSYPVTPSAPAARLGQLIIQKLCHSHEQPWGRVQPT